MLLELSSDRPETTKMQNPKRRAWMKQSIVIVATVVAALFFTVLSTHAATKTALTGARDWSDANDWSTTGVPANGDAVIIPAGSVMTLNTNTNSLLSLTISGTLTIGNSNTNRTITVTGTVTINTGGIFQTAGDGGNIFTLGGSLANAGTFDAVIGGATMNTTFNGSANQTVSGAGGTTHFNLITINNTGAVNANIVEIASTNFTVPAGFLTLTDGIFKVSGSFTLSNTFFPAAPYTINSDEGIWLNNPNATVTAQGGDMNLSGLLRVSQGTYNIGNANDLGLIYATGSTIDIQGGALNIAGPLQGTTVSSLGTTNTTTYSQSGGTVSTAMVGVNSSITASGRSYGSFDIHATGSSFTMSAGTIILQNPTAIPSDYVVGATLGSVTGGLVQFGNASTTIPNRYLMTSTTPIFNLTIKDTASPYAAMAISPLTVKGVLTIDAGAEFRAQNMALNVAGNWVNNGVFTPGSQITTLNGTAAQTISGSSTTAFSSLTINNSSGVSLSGVDATVNAVLALNSGDLTTGANALNMAVGATSTGTPAPGTDVVGNVRRTHTFTTGTTYAFGNQFVSLNFTGAGTKPTSLTINLAKSVPTGVDFGFSTAIQRTYTVTPTAGSGYSATLRLHYLNSELNGNNESSADFDLWRHNGVNMWQRQVKTANNTADTANWAEKSGVTQFSAWTLAGGSPSGPGPTAVRLTSFNAWSSADGVRLTWASGYEVNNLGFNLYREKNGQRSRVTPSVVAGSALTVGQGNHLTAGYSYSWFDSEGTADTGYHLEAIDLDGSRQLVGPVYPFAVSSSEVGRTSSRRENRALLLTELSGASRGDVHRSETGWPASITPSKKAERSLRRKSHAASILGTQQSIAAGAAVKMQIRQTGWYRVSRPEIVAAGLDASSDARLLQLFVDGEEVPIRMNGEGPSLGDIEGIEFYGVGLDTPTADSSTYWLVQGNAQGKRIAARPQRVKTGDLYWTGNTGVRSFNYTTERREKLIYSSFLLNGDEENIFGQLIYSEPVPQSLKVSHFDREAPGQETETQLEIALQGLSAQSHEVRVEFNGTEVGRINFAGVEHPVKTFAISRSLVVDGDNVVSLRSTNGDSDVSLLDWIRLTYAHRYVADNNQLAFSAPAGRIARVDGFSTSDLRVVDVTNPHSPIELQAIVEPSKSGYSARVQAADAPRTLLAFAATLVQSPAAITANVPSNWNLPTNGADMLIVTHKNFRQAIEPLANLRRSQGLVVQVVDVDDVYDEYSYGTHTPVAIKSFLMSAAASWSRKPKYLLLVGDSSWDPRNYLNEGANDFVPTKLIDTTFLETASDDWLVDFTGLGMPDMAIGRLPARTVADADLMVAKIMSYEQERELKEPLRNALLVADNGFETQSAQIGTLVPSGMGVEIINRSGGSDDLTRSQIVQALNQGPMIVNYYGHGSVGVWTGAGLFDSELASGLTNTDKLSLYVMMTCLNGYGHDAYVDSLAESALKARNGGAVAVWASTGFTETQSQFALDQEFYRQLFGDQVVRLGDAIRNAKTVTSNSDVRRTWVLFGDPAMRMR